jgi:hypothetical protein
MNCQMLLIYCSSKLVGVMIFWRMPDVEKCFANNSDDRGLVTFSFLAELV